MLSLIERGEITVDTSTGAAYNRDGRRLRTSRSVHGYSRTFYELRKYIHTARLCLIAHSGLPDNMFLEAAHLDDDMANNSISNLRWSTRSENIAAAYRTGTKPRNEREPKLSATQRGTVRKLFSEGWTLGQLARAFKTSILTIKKFIEREPRKPGYSKPYRIQSPTGEIFAGTDLKEFCRLMELCYTAMLVARRTGESYQGWSHLSCKNVSQM